MNEIMTNCVHLHKKVPVDQCGPRHVESKRLGGPRLPCAKCSFGINQAAKEVSAFKPLVDTPLVDTKVAIDPPKEPAKQEEKPVKTSIYFQGICPGCQKDKSILSKKGICQACLRVEKGARPPIDRAEKKPTPDKNFIAAGASQKNQGELKLDFLPYYDIFERLLVLAHSEMRSVEAQAIWILKYHLEDKK